MNELFQRFVTHRLKTALRGTLQVDAEPDVCLAEKRRVSMRPDVVFRVDNNNVFVADVKYKITHTSAAMFDDYFQLLAYTTAMALESGVLIYCHVEANVPEREIVVRHAGKRLVMFPLNLQGSREQLEKSIDSLADAICQRVSAH